MGPGWIPSSCRCECTVSKKKKKKKRTQKWSEMPKNVQKRCAMHRNAEINNLQSPPKVDISLFYWGGAISKTIYLLSKTIYLSHPPNRKGLCPRQRLGI